MKLIKSEKVGEISVELGEQLLAAGLVNTLDENRKRELNDIAREYKRQQEEYNAAMRAFPALEARLKEIPQERSWLGTLIVKYIFFGECPKVKKVRSQLSRHELTIRNFRFRRDAVAEGFESGMPARMYDIGKRVSCGSELLVISAKGEDLLVGALRRRDLEGATLSDLLPTEDE